MSNETLSLEDAAQFLQLSEGVLRQRARQGRIKAAKPGKRWVFLKSDLVDYLDALYAERGNTVSDWEEDALCHLFNDKERGGLTLEVQAEKEYAALLRLPIKR